MALTRALLNSLATAAMDTLGDATELVTYNYKATSDAAAVTAITNVKCHFARYRKAEIQAEPMLRNFRRIRIPFASLSIEPTRNDTIVRTNAEKWSVEAVEDGEDRPSWFLQVRQVT